MSEEDRARVRSLLDYMPVAWGIEYAYLGARSVVLRVSKDVENLIVPHAIHGIPVEIKLLSEKESDAA